LSSKCVCYRCCACVVASCHLWGQGLCVFYIPLLLIIDHRNRNSSITQSSNTFAGAALEVSLQWHVHVLQWLQVAQIATPHPCLTATRHISVTFPGFPHNSVLFLQRSLVFQISSRGVDTRAHCRYVTETILILAKRCSFPMILQQQLL